MERCGIKLVSDTLRANRETTVLSMVHRGPYGRVEDWSGEIAFEVLGSCVMSSEMQGQVACAMAADLIENSILVSAWNIAHIGSKIILTPQDWDELEQGTRFRRLEGWVILIAPWILFCS